MTMSANDDWRSSLCRLMQRNRWELVSCDELWALVMAERPDGIISETDLHHVARLCYGPVLHTASLPTATVPIREQAFHEIHQYCYRLFAGHYRDRVASETLAELAQETILTIHRRLEECQSPKTFLQFIYFQFRTVNTTYRRRLEHQPMMVEDDFSELPEFQQPADPNAEIPHDLLLFRDCLAAALARLTNEKMRNVIIYTYEYGWNSIEIANELNLTSNNVNVLRSRGLQLLRNDEALHRCLAEN